MRCPKCAFEAEDGSAECPRCGVIFSRYRPRPETPPEPASVPSIPITAAGPIPPPAVAQEPAASPDAGAGSATSGRAIAFLDTAAESVRAWLAQGPFLILGAALLLWLSWYLRPLWLRGLEALVHAVPGSQELLSFLEFAARRPALVLSKSDTFGERFAGFVRQALALPIDLLVLGLLVQQMILSRRGDGSWQVRLRAVLRALLPMGAVALLLGLLILATVVIPFAALVLLAGRSVGYSVLLFYTVPGLLALVAVGGLSIVNGLRVALKYGLALPVAALEGGGPFLALRRGAALTRRWRLRAASLLLPPVVAGWLTGFLAFRLLAWAFRYGKPGMGVSLAVDRAVSLALSTLLALFLAATVAVVYERLTGELPPDAESASPGPIRPRLARRAAALLLGMPALFALVGWLFAGSGNPAQRARFEGPETPFVQVKRVIHALNRCLGSYLAQRASYPRDLSALGPAGTRCASEIVENREPHLAVTYAPGVPDASGGITTYRVEVRSQGNPPNDFYVRSDESTALFSSSRAETTPDPAMGEGPAEGIQMIDLDLQRFRKDHGDRGYPRRLELEPGISRAQREIEAGLLSGTLDGFRYTYTPDPPDAAGNVTSYRIDVRPVRYGAPFKRSYLCDPRGILWETEADRPARPGDHPSEGEGFHYYCAGHKYFAKDFSTMADGSDPAFVLRTLNRCLEAYRLRSPAGYPPSLAALGPAGTRCARPAFVDNHDPDVSIVYTPGPPAAGGAVATYQLRVHLLEAQPPFNDLASDETSRLALASDPEKASSQSDSINQSRVHAIQWIDRALGRFRRRHGGYPRTLRALDDEDPDDGNREAIKVRADIREGLRDGRLDGYRYLYTPGTPDRQGNIASYRLDVRPVRYSKLTNSSLLCDPRGILWFTDQDRPAQATDKKVEDPRYCVGEREGRGFWGR